jgi:prolyl-tRNA synthetase
MKKNNLALVPWCEDSECEQDIKASSYQYLKKQYKKQHNKKEKDLDANDYHQLNLIGSAKPLCIPFEQPEMKEEHTCIKCEKKAKRYALFGRSY